MGDHDTYIIDTQEKNKINVLVNLGTVQLGQMRHILLNLSQI